MKKAWVLPFLAIGAIAGADARGQAMKDTPAPAVEEEEKTWAFNASAFTYLLPEEPDYAQPTFMADRGRLHLEGRYNYEGLRAGSAWVGYNWSFGEKLTLDLTPMVGGVFGDTTGIAPGYEALLSWRKLELSSESEYVFDTGSSSDNFFYTWSELAWAPADWFRLGVVVQRTKVYKTDFDIQRGFLVGFAYKNATFTTYVFNPDASRPTVVLGVGLSF